MRLEVADLSTLPPKHCSLQINFDLYLVLVFPLGGGIYLGNAQHLMSFGKCVLLGHPDPVRTDSVTATSPPERPPHMLPAPSGSLHTHDAARSGFLPGRVRRSTDTPGPSPVSVTERCARAFLSLLGQVCWLVLRTEQKSCPGPTRRGALHAPQPLVRLLLGGVCSDLWPSFNRSTCFFYC